MKYTKNHSKKQQKLLGGGFKYLFVLPLPGEMIQFD